MRTVLLMACAGTLGVQDGVERHASHRGEGLHEEMIELLHEIGETLVRIDDELLDAAAGEAPLATEGDGIRARLLSSRRDMQTVVESIDRILAIRDHHEGSS